MPQGSGGKVTPSRVVSLLRDAVAKSSQSAVARDTGLTQSAVNRYLKGIGEPTTSTLERLSDYFGESVEWLRGGKRSKTPDWTTVLEVEYCQKALADLIEIYEIVPDHLKETVRGYITQELDAADDVIKFHNDLPSEMKYSLIGLMCDTERIVGLENWRGKPEVIAGLKEVQKKQSRPPAPTKKPRKRKPAPDI